MRSAPVSRSVSGEIWAWRHERQDLQIVFLWRRRRDEPRITGLVFQQRARNELRHQIHMREQIVLDEWLDVLRDMHRRFGLKDVLRHVVSIGCDVLYLEAPGSTSARAAGVRQALQPRFERIRHAGIRRRTMPKPR